MTVVLLAILWVPLSIHCELERLSVLEFLSCCPHEPSPGHADADCAGDECAGDVCAVVESGLYKNEDRPALVVSPELNVFEPALSERFLSVDVSPSVSFPEFPPGHLMPWQFSLRAAPSPRAPSAAS